MLRTRSVNPSQIGPWALSTAAEAQSSIRAPRMMSMPPASRKNVGADQHAAAGGGRHRALPPIHAGERVKHLKEEDECRDIGALGEALAAQLHHQRCQHEPVGFGVRDQPADGIGRVHDIGIGEQEIIRWRRRRRCGIDALLHRPELSRPSRRQAAARHHAQPLIGMCRSTSDLGGAVAAVIVNQDDRHRPPIILAAAASRCSPRCSPPHCAQAPRRRRAARPRVPSAPSRRARRNAKTLRAPAADRARPQAPARQRLSPQPEPSSWA